MNFLNTTVDIASLPAVEKVPLQPVHPSYLKILRIEWMITTLVLALITAALIYFIPSLKSGYGWAWVVTGFLVISAYYFLMVERSFPYLSYAVREHDVLFQKGWIIRKLRICPFKRTQNCSIQTGPLERRFGLASLIIYTAGSEGADMRIPGLLLEEADSLRHFILSNIHTEADDL